MSAYVVLVRIPVIDAQALERYRKPTPAARDAHPLEPLAFYGAHEVLEGDSVDEVAILHFTLRAAAKA